MPEILDFEWERMDAFKILIKGEKVGTIVPNANAQEKSIVTFESSFDGNQKIARKRLIRTFFESYLSSNKTASVQQA